MTSCQKISKILSTWTHGPMVRWTDGPKFSASWHDRSVLMLLGILLHPAEMSESNSKKWPRVSWCLLVSPGVSWCLLMSPGSLVLFVLFVLSRCLSCATTCGSSSHISWGEASRKQLKQLSFTALPALRKNHLKKNKTIYVYVFIIYRMYYIIIYDNKYDHIWWYQ